MVVRVSVYTHGSGNTYDYRRCRCDLCKRANAERHLRARDRRRARLATADVKHGFASTYTNWDCRCEPCREAGAVKNAADRRRRARASAP